MIYRSSSQSSEESENFISRLQTAITRIQNEKPDVPGLNVTAMNTRELCDLLLYGDPKLNLIANRIIIEATISFIERSRRFGVNSC